MAVAITMTGQYKLNKYIDDRIYKQAARNALTRLLEIHMAASKRSYLSQKKKTPKLPSMIFDSFKYDIKSGNTDTAVGVVTCGGISAPHAYYVNYPHRLRNGRIWPGYFFMEKGAVFTKAMADKVIKEEINKLLHS